MEDTDNVKDTGSRPDRTATTAPITAEQVARLVVRFCSALRHAKRLSWLAREVRLDVERVHADLERFACGHPLRLVFDDDAIRVGDARMDDLPVAAAQLVRMVRRKGWRAIEFTDGVRTIDVLVLLQILQSKTKTVDDDDLASLRSIRPIDDDADDDDDDDVRVEIPTVVQPSRLGRMVRDDVDADVEVRSLVSDITQAIDNISREDVEASPRQAPVTNGASGLLDLVDQLGRNAEIALILSSLRRHDAYTYDHSINVGLLSICLARHVGWRGRDLHEFGVAALIHDVGKLYTPLEVLNKPSRLGPQEWVVMKRHPRDGYDILREGGVGSDIAPSIAIEHHTQPDGVGYPPLPYGVERMHPGSKIVKIADAYDAFTTIRPYRSQTRPKEALKMLRSQAGQQFDGELVEAFCAMMGDYPIGSTLKLESGRIGLVVDVHGDAPDRPLVRVLRKADGRTARSLELVDLRALDPASGRPVDGIVEAIDPVIRNIPIGRYV